MSPGRCALPSGMFSTRPIAPIALTLALRAASACISPTTQAAPAMSPFMSSMPAAGLIEMPPVSKHTPLPMKRDRRVAFLAAVPAHDHHAAVAARALPDAEQRAHAELLHRLDVENLDRDAELLQRGARGARIPPDRGRWRLVDQIARHDDAVGDRLRGCSQALLRGRDVGDREGDLRLGRRLLALLALGLVAVERIGAQLRAERQVGGLRRASARRRRVPAKIVACFAPAREPCPSRPRRA